MQHWLAGFCTCFSQFYDWVITTMRLTWQQLTDRTTHSLLIRQLTGDWTDNSQLTENQILQTWPTWPQKVTDLTAIRDLPDHYKWLTWPQYKILTWPQKVTDLTMKYINDLTTRNYWPDHYINDWPDHKKLLNWPKKMTDQTTISDWPGHKICYYPDHNRRLTWPHKMTDLITI